MMEQQEVKNFSSFSKSLKLWASFVNQSSILPTCLCAFQAAETTTAQGLVAHLPRAVTGQIPPSQPAASELKATGSLSCPLCKD